MVNYYDKFTPGLALKCANLNDLLHKDATLESSEALGVTNVISHALSNGRENVITYTFCKLSQAEKNDAKIQQEAFSIIHGVQKF